MKIFPFGIARLGANFPQSASNRVVFPDPDEPIILRNCPERISPLIFLIISFGLSSFFLGAV